MKTQVVDKLEENPDKEEPQDSNHRRHNVPCFLGRVEWIPRNNHCQIFQVDESVEDRVAKACVSFKQIEKAEDVHCGCYDVEKELLDWVLTEVRVLKENPDEHNSPVRSNYNKNPVGERWGKEREADDSCAHSKNAPEEHWNHCDPWNVGFVW